MLFAGLAAPSGCPASESSQAPTVLHGTASPLHLAAQAGTGVMISYTSAQGTAAEVTYEAVLCGRALLPCFCSLVRARR